MFQNIKQLAILDKVFNVHGGEWHKIIVVWVLRFLYRSGFVLGWTLIVAMFVGRYGISNLPYLFALNALFTIIGTFLYSNFLEKYSQMRLMLATIFISGALLFFGTQIYSISTRGFLFILLFTEAVFLLQFRILLLAYIEKLFTPLESERTFPLIESSVTIGGIISGLLIVLLSSHIQVYKFVYIWIGLLFLLVPTVIYCESYYDKILFFTENKIKPKAEGLIKKFKKEFANFRHTNFIKGLFIIVFLQWVLFNLLEFQYTNAVYSNVKDVVLEGGSGFEHTFVHDLGALFMLFSFSALLVQFFVGSRLINSLGIIGSMLLHPIVTIFSLFGLTFSYGFSTAVLAKNNFTITSVLWNNAYHSAYYAVKEQFRHHTREILEGFVRPIGALIGTSAIILLQSLFTGENLTTSINVVLLLTTLVLFFVNYAQQKKYTDVAIHDLAPDKAKVDRKNAIDILAQRGHRKALVPLLKLLRDHNESLSIRIRVLGALGELQDYRAIDDILNCLDSKRLSLREAAVLSLLSYKKLRRKAKRHLYLRLKIVNKLKRIYEIEKNERIKHKIISLMSFLSGISAIEFLLEILDKGNSEMQAEAIFNLGNYRDPDVSKFLRPYLKSKNHEFQIAAAISLGRVRKYLPIAKKKIDEFFVSFDNKKVALALFAIGELKLKRRKRDCVANLYSSDLYVKMHSSLALAKMGYHESVPVLVELLFHKDKDIAKHVKRLLKNVDTRVYQNVDKIVKYIVSDKVNSYNEKIKDKAVEDLNQDQLQTLKWLYCLAEEYDEVESLDILIK